MDLITQIHLNKFKRRDYQQGLWDAVMKEGKKKALVIWPRRCLSGDSHILMADGSFKFLKNISQGDKVLSWDGSKYVSDTVKNVWKTEEKDTVLVSSQVLDPLISSKDHLFLCRENTNRFSWLKAEAIHNKTVVVCCNGAYREAIVEVADYGREELYDMETTTHHNFVANGYLVHNSGKDLTIWDIVINLALRRTTITYYIFPTYSQARKALFDSMTNDGKKFLDYIPPECIMRKNEQEMKITLYNNSIIQFVGSTDYDKLMGTNPSVCVFSEYALQDPRAYQYIRPILTANNGLAIFCSTVRGKNALFDLYNIAKDNPAWYCSKLSVEDTKHIDIEEIDNLVLEGEMSFDMARQEFWNDFNLGVEGSFYARYLERMELEGRLGKVPWENDFKVHTAWDLGMSDSMSIIFFQTIGSAIHVIDTYQNSDRGLEHYIEVLNSKPWHKSYGVHVAPHDIRVRELGTGLSRQEKARQLGIEFDIAPNISIVDGIEGVRTTLGRMYINTDTCKPLIETLANYRKVFNEKNGVYDTRPLHDKYSHMADALRYLCLSLPKTRDSVTPDELDRIRQEALYGECSYNRGPFAQRGIRKY